MAGTAAFQVQGLNEFVGELKAIDPKWGPALTKLNKVIADEAAEGARGIAIGMGGIQGRAADAIKGSSNTTEAQITVRPGSRFPMANPAFWGAKRHTGWYAKSQYDNSAGKQFPDWVGNSWEAGAANGGPYAINRALFLDLSNIVAHYQRMLTELTAQAFPL